VLLGWERRQSDFSPGLVDQLRSHDLLHLFDGQVLQDEVPVPFGRPIHQFFDEPPKKHVFPSASFLAENALEQRRPSHGKQADAHWRKHERRGGPKHSESDGSIKGIPRLSRRVRLAINSAIVGTGTQEEGTVVTKRANKSATVDLGTTVDALHNSLSAGRRWSSSFSADPGNRLPLSQGCFIPRRFSRIAQRLSHRPMKHPCSL
jgi:hypothetical protein